jgi:hypothetical protein
MGFDEKRAEQLRNMPIIETKISKSKDGRFVLHKTLITDIKPREYYDKVFDGAAAEAEA